MLMKSGRKRVEYVLLDALMTSGSFFLQSTSTRTLYKIREFMKLEKPSLEPEDRLMVL